MNSRFSKLTFLHILEVFTSTFNSQETIVFLRSFAQKVLGSFLGTTAIVNEQSSYLTFIPETYPLLWFLVRISIRYHNKTPCQHEDLVQDLISAFIFSLNRMCHREALTEFLGVTQKLTMEHGIKLTMKHGIRIKLLII